MRSLMPEALHEALLRSGLRVATAESCTGGMLAAALTYRAGSSAYFEGAMVAYQERRKEAWLDVRAETLARYTAVSEKTAQEMLMGILASAAADVGLATTGYAGPGGGTATEPCGTVYIACGNKTDYKVHRCVFSGTRAEVRASAVRFALKELATWLQTHLKEDTIDGK